MAKEKKRTEELQENKVTPFYYEIIGMFLIVISIAILGKFGKFGKMFTSFFKVGFGDWYWLFIIFFLILGFYNVFMHKSFNFKNQKFIGFVFLMLGILIFSHFSMHKYINSTDTNYFSATWQIYKSYINLEQDIYLGGGLVGSVVFYLFYYLIGEIGCGLVASILMILGLSLLINKSLTEIVTFIGSGVKNIKQYTNNFNSFFKYELGNKRKKDRSINNIYNKSRQVPLKLFEDYQNKIIQNVQEKLSMETKSLICSLLSNMNLEYREDNMLISYQITTYVFIIYNNYDINILYNNLKKIIEESILVATEKDYLFIQINNKQNNILTNRNILIKQSCLYNNYLVPLGISYDNKLIENDINNNLLIVGDYNSGIRNFIIYLITTMFIKINIKNYTFELFDSLDEMEQTSKVTNNIEIKEILNYLDKIKSEIDERLELFNKTKVDNIDEYNKKQEIEEEKKEVMKRKFIIINNLDISEDDLTYFENRLMYINQLGNKVGYTIIYIIRNESNITSIILSLFDIKVMFYTIKNSLSKKILGNINATYLNKDGDAFYVYKGQTRRIQTPLVRKKDIESVSSYLK